MTVLQVVLVELAAVNALTFLAFGCDKWMARRRSRRTPEKTLLFLAFLGGLVGAWAGMHVFRHKTRKPSFRIKLALVSALNPLWPTLWLIFTGRL